MSMLAGLNALKREALDDVSRVIAPLIVEQVGGDTILPTGELVRVFELPCYEVRLTVLAGANHAFLVATPHFGNGGLRGVPVAIDLTQSNWFDSLWSVLRQEAA